MEEFVYLNGELMPRSWTKLSLFDHGFLYGYGLFETMRSYNGVIFRLEQHLTRLFKSAEILGLDTKLGAFDLNKACYQVIKFNKLNNSRLRLTVTGGEGDITPNPSTCDEITVFIVARRLIPLPPEIYDRGFTAIISSIRRNSRSPLATLKSTCYLENILAKQEAKATGSDESLILNEKGNLAEASSSNIFLVDQEALITPSLKSGILPGVTREVVLGIARSMGIKTIERDIKPEKLLEADEAFITNSIIEIMPLTYINSKPIGTGEPGIITKRIAASYNQLINNN
jgi:branched-chain amino acid aminotransferase group I